MLVGDLDLTEFLCFYSCSADRIVNNKGSSFMDFLMLTSREEMVQSYIPIAFSVKFDEMCDVERVKSIHDSKFQHLFIFRVIHHQSLTDISN